MNANSDQIIASMAEEMKRQGGWDLEWAGFKVPVTYYHILRLHHGEWLIDPTHKPTTSIREAEQEVIRVLDENPQLDNIEFLLRAQAKPTTYKTQPTWDKLCTLNDDNKLWRYNHHTKRFLPAAPVCRRFSMFFATIVSP